MIKALKSLQDLDVLIAKISASTGLSSDEISSQMSSANIPTFQLDDMILVSSENFDVAIDSWVNQIKTDLGLGISPKTSTSKIENKKIVSSSSLESESRSLSWPEGFEKLVNHQYGPSLKKILPADPKQSRAYLEAIAHGTKEGQRLTEQMVDAIVTNWGLDKMQGEKRPDLEPSRWKG